MDLVYYRNKHNPGLGNLVLDLAALLGQVKYVHKSILDYEFSNCIELHGFTIVDTEGAQHPPGGLYINQFTIQNIHPRIRDIIKPTPYLRGLIEAEKHVLEGVSCAVNIRRGSYSPDSTMYCDDRAKTSNHYFCSDSGLEKFKDVIRQAPGKVYVTSDSPSTKKDLKTLFGDKVVMHETQYAHTAPQTLWAENQTIKNLQDVYLIWFLLSMCPVIFVTGGRSDLVGFSTYGYAAAIYGSKPFQIIFND
jgi:hypothetical protein